MGSLPAPQLDPAASPGCALVLYTSGDKYIGGLAGTKRQGEGMYVYASGAAYKGQWEQGALEGQEHPGSRETLSEEVQRLNEMNERHAQVVQALKQRMGTEKKQLPPV